MRSAKIPAGVPLSFKNQGERAGATLEHVHSQLIALPIVPADAGERIARRQTTMTQRASCYLLRNVRAGIASSECVWSQAVQHSSRSALRAAFCLRNLDIAETSCGAFEQADEDIAALAKFRSRDFTRLNRPSTNPPFNYLIHSMPSRDNNASTITGSIDFLPQIARAAGFEWGSGMHMNSVAPEDGGAGYCATCRSKPSSGLAFRAPAVAGKAARMRQ